MVMRYVVYPDGAGHETWGDISRTWSPIHGLIYMIYVVLAFDLWLRMKWKLPRMLLLMFFGVIPVLSFFGEQWTKKAVDEDLRRRPTLQDAERAERDDTGPVG
jgi:integral membrane protein